MNRIPNDKLNLMLAAKRAPLQLQREYNNRNLYHFLQYFWDVVSNAPFTPNWHIQYICDELMLVAHRVGTRQQKLHDLIINLPPGMTKTITCSIMFPAWCWTQWYWMRFITASYSGALSLESAEYSRDLIRSQKFQDLYPELAIREDRDTKSNFKIVKRIFGTPGRAGMVVNGGNRYSTSVGGTLMGFHGDINIWDDALNPTEAVSDKDRDSANRWVDQSLSTRKTDKGISVTIGIMQRLHQDDPTGHILAKKKINVRHICMPGEIRNFRDYASPPEIIDKYVDDLLDSNRLNWINLKELEADLGQYGYAGQIGQNPTPPGGGMFKVDHFQTITPAALEDSHKYIMQSMRYWDKAGSSNIGAWTVGVLMHRLNNGKYIVEDVKRGQWAAEERERVIQATAETDGRHVKIYMEQEPGSGGKDSVQGSIRGLAGFAVYTDRPTGKKEDRADPYSVQVNNDNVSLLRAEWNETYKEELRFFPYGTFKDQVDASSGAFNLLTQKKIARMLK